MGKKDRTQKKKSEEKNHSEDFEKSVPNTMFEKPPQNEAAGRPMTSTGQRADLDTD